MRYSKLAGAVALLFMTSADSRTAETEKDQQAAKKALQSLYEYIGAWNGNGESKSGKSESWKERMNWGWKFRKDGSSWLQVEFKDDKSFDKGELKFLPDQKKYQLTLTDKDKKELVFLARSSRSDSC